MKQMIILHIYIFAFYISTCFGLWVEWHIVIFYLTKVITLVCSGDFLVCYRKDAATMPGKKVHGSLAFPAFQMAMTVSALILSYFPNSENGFGPISNVNLEIPMRYSCY